VLRDQRVVAGEPAAGEQYAPAERLAPAAPLAAHRHATHRPGVVPHQPLGQGGGAHAHVRVAACRPREVGAQAGAAALARPVQARDGMAGGAVLAEQLDVRSAAVREPGHDGRALGGERRRQLGLDVVMGRGEDVGGEALGAVVDAGGLLPAAPRGGDHLGLARRPATQPLGALDDDRAAAAVRGHHGGGEAADARTDDHEIHLFMPRPAGHAGGLSRPARGESR